jgi:ribosomal protein S12 methylthiotransferase accessory factor
MVLVENSESDVQATAIHYRGQAYRGVKYFWRGTQRSIAPAETLERIRPYFSKFGITRLANVTGLDWIGIPVTLAMRPNASTLSNGSGKGFSLDAAMVSGAMEAIELYHAEEAELPTFQMPYEQLPQARIPIENLPLTKRNLFTTWWPFRWTLGWDIMNQEEVAVPWWLVHMGPHPLRARDLHTFQVSSNGLASGNNLLEAINAGLFEVIERDAVTCHRLAWERLKQLPPIVDPDTIDHELVRELMQRLAAASVGLVLFDCTLDTAVPVYMAYIYDLRVRNMGIYRGYGAHLDPEVAMIRAITEAVQGRGIYIAGSRDDVFRHSYLRLKQPDDSILVPALKGLKPTVDARQSLSEATPTFEGDTQAALEKLRKAGLKQAIVIDISLPDLPIKIVKVVVPGLEGYMFDFYEPGHRAQAFLQRRQVEGSHIPGPVASS